MRTWSWRRGGNGVQDGAIFLDDYVVVRLDFELSPITDSHDGIDGTAQFIVDALNAAERVRDNRRVPVLHMRGPEDADFSLCNMWRSKLPIDLTEAPERVTCFSCLRSMESKDKPWRKDKGVLA